MVKPASNHALIVLLAAFLLIALAGCTPADAQPQPASPTPDPSVSPTLEPTEPPTPAPDSAQVIYLGSGPEAAEARALAEAEDLSFSALTALSPDDLTAATRLVVLEQLPENIDALRSAAPDAQFLLLNGDAGQAGGNLSVVVADSLHRAFVGGYLAQMLSPDFRGAGLLPAGNDALADAFENGGRYLCGRCVPVYAPVVLFPVLATAPEGADLNAWQAAYAEIEANRLETVFVDPAASQPEVLAFLMQQNLTLVGGQTPPEEIQPAWAATIGFDRAGALKSAFPELLAGRGGQAFTAPVTLSDVDENRVTPGKQRMLQKIIDDLAAGWLEPLSVPGEPVETPEG